MNRWNHFALPSATEANWEEVETNKNWKNVGGQCNIQDRGGFIGIYIYNWNTYFSNRNENFLPSHAIAVVSDQISTIQPSNFTLSSCRSNLQKLTQRDIWLFLVYKHKNNGILKVIKYENNLVWINNLHISDHLDFCKTWSTWELQ